MFLLVGLISGPGSVGASLTECSMSRGCLQVESYPKTGVLVYKSSWLTLSVTSRREILTSRRHFKSPLSRRDVDFSRRDADFFTSRRQNCSSLPRRDVRLSRHDVIFEALCHVVTWDFNVATWNSHVATSLLHVATSFGHLLCHVAT